VLLSDGINSTFRTANEEHFGTHMDWRSNYFIWLGSTQSLDAFKYFFRETEHGVVVSHSYQYEKDSSTWVVEMEESTWKGLQFEGLDHDGAMRKLEGIFAKELGDHKFVADRLFWRQFPIITNKTWVKGNRVLLGDAKLSAHYSIGSGTKLAMEDAIALFDAIKETKTINDALKQYDTIYRSNAEKIQHAANVSLEWFEHMNMHWKLPRQAFAFSCMSRSKQVTYDNLRLRDDAVVPRYEEWFADYLGNNGYDNVRVLPPLFQPFKIAGKKLANRMVFAPISQYRAKNGVVNEWHFSHYSQRALGGASLVMTEMVAPSMDGRFTEGCPVIETKEQADSWKSTIDFIHQETDSLIGIQIGHAGRRGACVNADCGSSIPMNNKDAWPLISASEMAWNDKSQMPRAMTVEDMAKAKSDFKQATKRALDAGFDWLEINAGHGTLLASFISPLTNLRKDAYGGSIGERMKFPLEVLQEVREVWPTSKPLSVCITACDWAEGGITKDEAAILAIALKSLGVDLISVSTGETVSYEKPVYGRMYQAQYSDLIRNSANIPTLTTGNITTPDQGSTLIASMRSDLVGFGRPLLVNPYLPMQAAATYGVNTVRWPEPYTPARQQAEIGLKRQWEDVVDMRVRLKPKSHALGA
ncbi:MAG: bifunctional salicylyl-CoA 5-hydroxylase/oxidoreductase, partial [Rhodospirillaceae bacterium]|nr:bifunctional salicylyl-CoA 5-hydroxylase/oxidoreductase [Rhodospirillaceae bacterium]